MVNNAAIFGGESMREMSLAEWQSYLAINVTAPYILSKEFAARLEAGAPRLGRRILSVL